MSWGEEFGSSRKKSPKRESEFDIVSILSALLSLSSEKSLPFWDSSRIQRDSKMLNKAYVHRKILDWTNYSFYKKLNWVLWVPLLKSKIWSIS